MIRSPVMLVWKRIAWRPGVMSSWRRERTVSRAAAAWTYGSKIGDRIAALDPLYQAVIDRFANLDADIARRIELRHDWGPTIGLVTSPAPSNGLA